MIDDEDRYNDKLSLIEQETMALQKSLYHGNNIQTAAASELTDLGGTFNQFTVSRASTNSPRASNKYMALARQYAEL